MRLTENYLKNVIKSKLKSLLSEAPLTKMSVDDFRKLPNADTSIEGPQLRDRPRIPNPDGTIPPLPRGTGPGRAISTATPDPKQAEDAARKQRLLNTYLEKAKAGTLSDDEKQTLLSGQSVFGELPPEQKAILSPPPAPQKPKDKSGMTKEATEVTKEIQQLLIDSGVSLSKGANGLYNQETANAVNKWFAEHPDVQKPRGVKSNFLATIKQFRDAIKSAAPQPNDKVKDIQALLNYLESETAEGYKTSPLLKITGILDEKTIEIAKKHVDDKSSLDSLQGDDLFNKIYDDLLGGDSWSWYKEYGEPIKFITKPDYVWDYVWGDGDKYEAEKQPPEEPPTADNYLNSPYYKKNSEGIFAGEVDLTPEQRKILDARMQKRAFDRASPVNQAMTRYNDARKMRQGLSLKESRIFKESYIKEMIREEFLKEIIEQELRKI
jgi:hypothetical protein